MQQMLESFYVDDLVSGDDIHPCPWCHNMSIMPLIMIIIMIIIIINFTHIDALWQKANFSKWYEKAKAKGLPPTYINNQEIF